MTCLVAFDIHFLNPATHVNQHGHACMVDGDIEHQHEFKHELDLVCFQVWGSMDQASQTDFSAPVGDKALSNHIPGYLAFGPATL